MEAEELEEFLERCADYRSTCYVNHRQFSFAHNDKPFACVHHGQCYADPELLVKP